jgi:hypothetical protein
MRPYSGLRFWIRPAATKFHLGCAPSLLAIVVDSSSIPVGNRILWILANAKTAKEAFRLARKIDREAKRLSHTRR